jgi:hypothetical protein
VGLTLDAVVARYFFLTLCEIFVVRCNAAHDEQMFCGFLVHAFLCRASIFAHGKGHLAVRVRKGARQTSFTVQNATVCPLPCVFGKNARQRACRAFLAFCRAPETHGKGLVSRSVSGASSNHVGGSPGSHVGASPAGASPGSHVGAAPAGASPGSQLP